MKLEQYDDGYILKNEKIELWMNHAGRADKVLYKGMNIIEKLNGNVVDPDRYHSFYLDYHQDLKSAHPVYTKFKVLNNDENSIHLVWIDDKSDLNLEYHIVMNSEDSKIYSYVIARNRTNKTYKINEMRTVYRLDKNIFPFSKTESRQGLQPSSNYTNQFKKWQDETYEMPDGERFSNSKVYSKYDYADYFKDNDFWGFFGSKLGFWFVPVSKDYYPSGPLKQELMVHYDGILLNYMNGAHFGTSDFTIKPGWQKCYGPWAIYINEGKDYNELFNDAKAFAQKETKSWPYQWMKEDLYPQKRAIIQGQIDFPEKYKLTVVLSQGEENFSKASAGYIYYADTDENGLFRLENVRKGKYKLTTYSREGEIPGEFIVKQIDIDPEKSQEINLGLIKVQENLGKVIWQIGIASHTTEPFKFSDMLRNSIWRKLVPANLDYYIGHSNAEEDWFAIQGYNGEWRIHFNISPSEKENLELILALAGASKTAADHENDRGHGDPYIDISINGCSLGRKYLLDDNAVYRNALKNGSYHLLKYDLDRAILKDNNNTISLSTNGYLMYDTIMLNKMNK